MTIAYKQKKQTQLKLDYCKIEFINCLQQISQTNSHQFVFKNSKLYYNLPFKINRFRDLEPPIMISNSDQLGELILKIQQVVDQNGFSEIAVDLEHNHQISYLGITCLIQLSTRTKDQGQSLQIILNKQDKRMDLKSYDLMVKLLELREQLGIQYDQNPRYFLPNPFLFKLVESKPNSIQELKSQFGGDKNINGIVKENLWQFLKVILGFDEKVPTVEIMKEEQLNNTTQIQIEDIKPSLKIELLKIIQIPINLSQFQNQNKRIVEHLKKNENVKQIKELFQCESPFKLLNLFHNGLGSQIFQSMKEQSQQQQNQLIQEAEQQKIQKINTFDFIQLPKLDETNRDQQKELNIRLNNTLQNQHGTKILKRHQKIEQQRTQKSNIINRFEVL